MRQHTQNVLDEDAHVSEIVLHSPHVHVDLHVLVHVCCWISSPMCIGEAQIICNTLNIG